MGMNNPLVLKVGLGVVGLWLEVTCRLVCTKLDWLLCEARSGLVLLDLLGFPTPFSHTTMRRVTSFEIAAASISEPWSFGHGSGVGGLC